MKDSAIASQIASGGLRVQVDSKVTQDYVLQNNQTDLNFCKPEPSHRLRGLRRRKPFLSTV
jgi:hypothetical protein